MDMLVRLYDEKLNAEPELAEGIRIVRPLTADKYKVLNFIRENFGEGWASETDAAFSRQPVTCLVAVNAEREIVGFAAYEATYRDYFGPTGVHPAYRKKGIGGALLLASLRGLRDLGYAYAIIGDVADYNYAFYHNICGAEWIEGSVPGIYGNLVKK